MKHKLAILLGSLALVSFGIGLGTIIQSPETIRITEQAQILQNTAVLESDELEAEKPESFEPQEWIENEVNLAQNTQTSEEDTSVSESSEISEAPVVIHDLPSINLVGDSIVYMESVDHYTELGAQAFDEAGTALDIHISGSVNRDCACEQVLTYTATDQWNQSVSTTRTVIVSHPNFASFETFTQDTQSLSLGQTVTFILSDTVSTEDTSVSRLDNVWISLQGNTGDFIEIPMVSKDEHSVTLQYTYASALPSTSYRFNGVYKSIERVNAVEFNVTWNINLRID